MDQKLCHTKDMLNRKRSRKSEMMLFHLIFSFPTCNFVFSVLLRWQSALTGEWYVDTSLVSQLSIQLT